MSESNIIPLPPQKRSLAAAALIRDAFYVSGLTDQQFASWLRAMAEEIEQHQQTVQ